MTFEATDIPKTAIKKEQELEKEIMNLLKLKRYEGWVWENPGDLSLEDLSFLITVKTNFPAVTKRVYPEINSFKDELSRILQDYGLEIQEWYHENTTYDTDDTETNKEYRRIDFGVKRRN